jgi:putative ABC transport system substrate-binding protein
MRRRELLLGATGMMAAPRGLRAQQKAMPVVGALSTFSPPANLGDLVRGPVHQGMSEMGFVEGQNIVWEYRWAEGHYDRLTALAADLVSRKVDVIITNAGTPPALAAKTQPRRSRSSSSMSATRSGSASSPVSPVQAATSRGSPISPPS